ncbi:hypothetical protein NKG05_08165 [Oerskovia sp. M15]
MLADGYELGGYNPVAGYGAAGEAKMYDGLVRLTGGEGCRGSSPRSPRSSPRPTRTRRSGPCGSVPT